MHTQAKPYAGYSLPLFVRLRITPFMASMPRVFASGMASAFAQLVSNSLPTAGCSTVCADVRMWLRREARAHRTYDLLVCAPPAWLPAKDEREDDWDFARDAQELVRLAMAVLAPGGALLLAPPMDAAQLNIGHLHIRNLSAETLPHDFVRSAARHCCLLVSV